MRRLGRAMKWLRVLSLCAVAALCSRTHAQEQEFHQYGNEEGLSNLNVRCLLQDQTGYLWAGTDNGIFRFDGRDFREYSHSDGLPSTEIQAVAESPVTGTLWVATPIGIARLQAGRFLTTGLSGSAVPAGMHQIAFDSGGAMYVLHSSGILRGILTNEGGYHFQPLVAGKVAGMLLDGNALYLSRDGDLLRMQGSHTDSIGKRDGLPSDEWSAMVRDSSHNLWVRSTTRLFELPAGSQRFVDRSADVPHALEPHISADQRGNVYVGSLAGAVILGGSKTTILDMKHGLPAETVAPILLDRNDALWLGMSGAGLVRRLGHGEWSSWKREEGLIHNSVWAIRQGTAGKVWVGTSGGLTLLGSDGATVRSWSTKNGLPSDRVLSIQEARSGDVFVGSDPHGLSQFSAPGKLLHVFGKREGFGRRVNAMSTDREGRIWAISGNSVLRSEPVLRPGSLPHFTRLDTPALEDDTIFRDIAMTPRGVVWIATSRGLLRYDADGWRCFTRTDGLLSDDLGAVAERDGDIWVAYRDALGLLRFTVEGNRLHVHAVTTQDGLSSNEVYGLLFDHDGHLWANSDKGVDVFRRGQWQHFGSEDGLVWDDTNGRALSVDDVGNVWIGTSGGMSRYSHPAHAMKPLSMVPAITGIRSGHNDWQPEDQPDLPYAERSLAFQFAALGSNSDRTRFRYRLLGAEDEWIETGETGVRFAALPAGDYVFEVSAQDVNGVWNDQPARFHFSIREPWWKSHYFVGAMLLLVAFVGRFFWSLRVRALVAQQERLQRVIDQQTAELREQHRQLENIAYQDQLTCLPNRRMFTQDVRGRMEASSREGGTFVLLLIDLDRFKNVNDTYGHDAGDAVLIATAERLRASLRVRDSIARLGGDEFAILLGEQIEFDVVERICARIVSSCCDPVFFGEQRLEIGCSIGIAVFPADGLSEAELCKAADVALYSVKRTTRNHFSWFGLTQAFSSQ